MQKELLLAIGDDRSASYNLRFLKEIFENFCDLKLTLFYVAPRMATWELEEKNLTPKGDDLNEFMAHSKSKGRKALEDAHRWIREIAGCSGDNVEIKLVHSQKGTVRELIDEAHQGLYDALLVGRKGLTWFEEVFNNSISHELLWGEIDFPVWICTKPPASPRHDVLLCMDGSKSSLRMVDHAGYMLAKEEAHTFTLFHVAQKGYESARAGRIFDEGLALLAENGIDDKRIELKMATARSVVNAIMKEVTQGNYSAVGLGKHGSGMPSRMENMFPSSTVVKLLRQLTDAALWVSK